MTPRLPINLVTHPMYRTPRPHHEDTNELPEDNDAVIIDADTITELIQTTTPSGNPLKKN